MKDGNGKLIYNQTKNTFDGIWKKNKMHGKGIWTYKDTGRQEVIEYSNGIEI